VEGVIRKTVLRKKPEHEPALRRCLENHHGEMARQLQASRLAMTSSDEAVFSSDYPLLPARRWFWEKVLRNTDQSGTKAQLRSQLQIVYEAARKTPDHLLEPKAQRVVIFPNRVEIRNPGTLPEGCTIDDLRSKQISRRRNPIVASLLQRIHLIEAWGRGISLILANAPNARFEQVGPILITIFPRTQQHESGGESGGASGPDTQVGEQVGEQVVKMLRRCAKEPQSKRDFLEAAGFANGLFLGRYTDFRTKAIESHRWN